MVARTLENKILAVIPCFMVFFLVLLSAIEFLRACTEPTFDNRFAKLRRADTAAKKEAEWALETAIRSRVERRQTRKLASGSSLRGLWKGASDEEVAQHSQRRRYLSKGWIAFIAARQVTQMQGYAMRDRYLKKMGLRAFKSWRAAQIRARNSLECSHYQKVLMDKTLRGFRYIAWVRSRQRARRRKTSPQAMLRLTFLYFTSFCLAITVTLGTCLAMWSVVICLTNVAQGGALSALFLVGCLIGGRALMKRRKNKKQREKDIRSKLEAKLETGQKDKFSLISRNAKEREANMNSLVPAKWVATQLWKIKTQLTKLMQGIVENWNLVGTGDDLRYIYSERLLDELQVHLETFHAAMATPRLTAMLNNVRKTLRTHSRLPETEEQWNEQGWQALINAKGPKSVVTIDGIVGDIEAAAKQSQKKLQALKARENAVRYFDTEEKKEEMIAKVTKKMDTLDAKNQNTLRQVVVIGVLIAFIFIGFKAFAPSGAVGQIFSTMLGVLLMLTFLGSGGMAAGGMAGGAMPVDGAVDGTMEGEMDDGGGEGEGEGEDEGEEEEEDEEGEDGKKKKGGDDEEGKGLGDLHDKVDMLMNGIVAMARGSGIPLDNLGFDEEVLAEIEQRVGIAAENEGPAEPPAPALARSDSLATDPFPGSPAESPARPLRSLSLGLGELPPSVGRPSPRARGGAAPPAPDGVPPAAALLSAGRGAAAGAERVVVTGAAASGRGPGASRVPAPLEATGAGGAAAGSREGLRRRVQAVERRRRAMAAFRRAGLSEEEAAQRASFAS